MGLPGRFVTVWKIEPDTPNYYNPAAHVCRGLIMTKLDKFVIRRIYVARGGVKCPSPTPGKCTPGFCIHTCIHTPLHPNMHSETVSRTGSLWHAEIHCPCSLKLHNTLNAIIHLLPQSLHQPFPTFTTQMLTNTTASTAHHSSVLCVHAVPHTPQSSTTTWTEIR